MADIVIHYTLTALDGQVYKRQHREHFFASESYHLDNFRIELFSSGFLIGVSASPWLEQSLRLYKSPHQIDTLLISKVEIVDD